MEEQKLVTGLVLSFCVHLTSSGLLRDIVHETETAIITDSNSEIYTCASVSVSHTDQDIGYQAPRTVTNLVISAGAIPF